MSSRKGGFTLIEIIIVTAIVAVLAGFLVPMIRSNIVQARMRRAEQDTKVLGEAMLAFNKNVTVFPIYKNGNATGPSDPVFTVLRTGDGEMPEAAVNPAEWLSSDSDTFENQLQKNTPGGSGAAYATTGEFAWRGPYLSAIRKDPWGNKYLCNAGMLKSGIKKAAWVLSAGPNESIETTFSQNRDAPVIGGDDIAFRIR